MSVVRRVWQVPDIECSGCANSIRRALGELAGIEQVEVDVEGKRVQVAFNRDQVSEDRITDQITAAGFSPSSAEGG